MIGAVKASDLAIAKGNKNLGRQLTNIAALGIPVGMALAGKASYDAYKAWKAKRRENAEKTASIEETGIYPEEVVYAMDSAEALYDDCLEKMAYAEDLYADAADYLNYYDYLEKQANEAEKDNQFYSNRLARDVGMGIATGVTAKTLKSIADPLVKKRDKRGLTLAGLAGLAGLARLGYGTRGIYDAYKQYATRPEKTASALETFVATIR